MDEHNAQSPAHERLIWRVPRKVRRYLEFQAPSAVARNGRRYRGTHRRRGADENLRRSDLVIRWSQAPYCQNLPDDEWLNWWPEKCYFYPMRDCPGWAPGMTCGRIGKSIPPEGD